jgi:glucose-6-phosphate 1-dehydrogenase
MEAPVSLAPEDICVEKTSVLKALQVVECCRGQYAGYRREKNVAPGSTTETYAELKLLINNFRWTGTPVYIRVGKALNRKGTEIGVTLKALPRLLFNEKGDLPTNRIVFKIQPSEGIILDLSSKMPGGELRVMNTNMTFCYRDYFKDEIPEAYQRLLLDALRGDRTLFVSAQEAEISWKKYEPILDKGELRIYEKGSVPVPCLLKDWIDFETYKGACD